MEISATPPSNVILEGSHCSEVALLKHMLNYISGFYISVPSVDENEEFDNLTKASVMAFQKIAGTTADGIVGPLTWRLLYTVYKDIKQNEAPPQNTCLDEKYPYPGYLLKTGASGADVKTLQKMLCQLAKYYPQIPVLAEDGQFGSNTYVAVVTFQNIFGLTEDGDEVILGLNLY